MNDLDLYRKALRLAISKHFPCTCRMSYIQRFKIDPSCAGCKLSELSWAVEKQFEELGKLEAEKILIKNND